MKTLRQSLRQQRHAIKPRDRVWFSKTLAFQAQHKLGKVQNGCKIALYLKNDEEIDPKHIKNLLKKRGIDVYLPVLVGKHLKFAKIGKKFKKNRFGINEPATSTLLNANQMNIIFMPLVGFDANKNRIGMGGGFYDRTLAFKKYQTKYRNPRLIGLAFDCQKVDKLKTQKWDTSLNTVITPTKVYN